MLFKKCVLFLLLTISVAVCTTNETKPEGKVVNLLINIIMIKSWIVLLSLIFLYILRMEAGGC